MSREVIWDYSKRVICDCGIANAPDEEGAKKIAWMCLGGPNMSIAAVAQVVELEAVDGELQERRVN